MEFLTSGVLQKLFREMGMAEKGRDDQDPFLLQIRSIIPVSAEGDLWPNQGFYLKVSDSSHAMYVSLPQEQDEMVLCNKLRLGQLIYVDRLESSHPVPTLRGIQPIPGRFPCIGNPQDLVSIDKLEGSRAISDSMLKMETKVVPEKKPPQRRRCTSASKVHTSVNAVRIMSGNSGYCDVKRESSDVKKRIQEFGSNFVDITVSTPSSTPAKRRSWTGRESLDANEFVKDVVKPTGGRSRSRSASTSPLCSAKYDSSEDNSNSKTRVKCICSATKSIRSSNTSKTSIAVKSPEKSIDPASIFSLVNDKKVEETTILWNHLPSILAKHGKEVFRLKEAAVVAAVDVLQEASAAEKILKSLSTYSKLQLAKANNQQPSVDKFFNLQNDISQILLIVQSLKSITPLREDDGDASSPGSVSEALKLALEKKKNATSWIKAALESELCPISSPHAGSTQATNTLKKSSTNYGLKPKAMNLVRMQRSKGEMHVGLAAEFSPPDWVKGSTVDAAAQLASNLQDDCKKWFLAHVENYLDEVRSKTISKSDHEVAEMMRQMKKLNDWLDMMVGRKINGSILGDSELEAYGRVRDKIYAVLLQNVERTAMALEHTNSTDEC